MEKVPEQMGLLRSLVDTRRKTREDNIRLFESDYKSDIERLSKKKPRNAAPESPRNVTPAVPIRFMPSWKVVDDNNEEEVLTSQKVYAVVDICPYLM